MALSAIFNVEFYNRYGERLERPMEWEPVLLQLDVDLSVWDEYSLTLNNRQLDLSLKKLNGHKKLVSEQIRLGAGHYKVNLTFNNQSSSYRFTIFPKKISTDSYKLMLEELVYALPADITISLNNLGALTGIDLRHREKITLAQEVLRLKRSFYGTDEKIGLDKILDELSRRPHHVLKINELWVNSEEVRKPNTAKIVQSLVQAHNITGSGKLLKVIDNRVEHSYNVYENQMVKLYVHQFKMKLFKLIKFFKVINYENMLLECEKLFKTLKISERKANFLEQVDLPSNFIFKTTMVLLNVPIYRAAMDGFLEFQKVLTMNIDDPKLDSPLENTPYLYQKWGTLKVLSVLLHIGHDLGYEVKKQRIDAKVMGGKTIKVLPDGKAALVLYHPISHTTVKFIPERSYTNKGKPLKSISYTQKPDISIEITNPNGITKVYLFDPKYKLDSEEGYGETEDQTFKPKKVDIDKMHSYRDAIRNYDGEPVVELAAILYPGDLVFYDKGLMAIQSNPSEGEELNSVLEKILKEALIFTYTKND